MLTRLNEFKEEVTEIGEVLSEINKLPQEFKENMMNKFKQEILGGGDKVITTVEEPVTQQNIFEELPTPKQEKTPTPTNRGDIILQYLPEMTHEEAEEKVQKIREKYNRASADGRSRILSEIPSIKGLAKKTGLDKQTVKNRAEKYNSSLMNRGLIGKIRLNPHNKYNSPAFYYKIKKEIGVKTGSCENNGNVQPMTPVYTKNDKPHKNQSSPWVILKNSIVYTYHATREERDEAFSIGEKENWDKAKMYKLPDYVIYTGNNKYSILIPGTKEIFHEKLGLKETREFIRWISEAKNYDGGSSVTFDAYWNVSYNKTTLGLPNWQYAYKNENGDIRYLKGSTLKKLEENMNKKGFKLSKTIGDYVIDLELFIQ